MDASPSPEQADLSLLLPRSTYWQIVHDLQSGLPPPADDSAEARAHRDRAAIAHVASMLPVNAEEARIAARSVAADAQATECLRLARQHPNDLAAILKCSAQSASMMRQANAARALLARLQTARRKRQADDASRDQDAWTEHAAIGLMADAIGEAAPEPPPPAPTPEPEPEHEYRQLSEAEQYAVTYPRRAAQIRSLGGLPEPCSFGPPPPELVHAIVTGTSPILMELDAAAVT
jgi:hypothetical protein